MTLLVACERGCSLFTDVGKNDAGDVSFVQQAVPKLLGRKIRGYEETRLLTDTISAIDAVAGEGKGRGEIVAALMQSPEFDSHWAEVLVDLLRVNRTGAKSQANCFGAPRHAAPDRTIADWVTNQLAGIQHMPPPAPFNMSDVVLSALQADNLFPIYSAYLFAMQALPPTGNMITELNRRNDLGKMFSRVYSHRNIDCLPCHNSSASRSGPQSRWNRHWPVWGLFERALFEQESGGDPDRVHVFFRTGVNSPQPSGDADDAPSGSLLTPWGNLTDCGQFYGTSASVDTKTDITGPYFVEEPSFGGANIWAVQWYLALGHHKLQQAGWLQRQGPPACDVCDEAYCQGTAAPPPTQAQIDMADAVATLFRLDKTPGAPDTSCVSCHGSGGTPPDLESANWQNNLILATGIHGRTLVIPNGSANSFLVAKISGTQGNDGSPMPLNGGQADMFDTAQIATVTTWIDQGIPVAGDIPVECNVCTAPMCTTDFPVHVDPHAGFAYIVAMNVVDQIWKEMTGNRLTISNYFPRTLDQSRALWYLTDFTFIANDWSLKQLLRRILLSSYFNRVAPLYDGGANPYEIPLVPDPWAEADPRYPPRALPGWQSGSPVTPDPSYDESAHPENHFNAMGEMVHRYHPRSLLYSAYSALGWDAQDAPGRFFDRGTYATAELAKGIGQFYQDSEPGFNNVDFQGLLLWETAHKACRLDAGGSDWITRLLDAVAAHNSANPNDVLSVEDVIVIVKDWLHGSGAFVTFSQTITFDSERGVLADMFGPLANPADVSTSTARSDLERHIRDYCGVAVKSPQFLLAGIAPRMLGPAPRLRVCNDPSDCTYAQMCGTLDGWLRDAGSQWRLNCAVEPLTASDTPGGSLLPIEELCRADVCTVRRWPGRELCLREDRPLLDCLPREPPACPRIGCEDIDCCGGPGPPRVGARRDPGYILAWLEGGRVAAADGVRIRLHANNEARPLSSGRVLAAGDALFIEPGAQLRIEGENGGFATPEKGMPAQADDKDTVLLVTGPTAVARTDGWTTEHFGKDLTPEDIRRFNQRTEKLRARRPKNVHNPHSDARRLGSRRDRVDDTVTQKKEREP